MTLETIGALSDDPAVSLPVLTARPIPAPPEIAAITPPNLHHAVGHDRLDGNWVDRIGGS